MSYIYEYKPIVNNQFYHSSDIQVSGLVIHSVGTPQPRADIFQEIFNRPSTTASVHGFIEPGRYIECLPTREKVRFARYAAHCGQGSLGSFNLKRIGIELTEPDTIRYISGASFEDLNPKATKDFVFATIQTAIEVFGDLCIFHNISPSLICSHSEAHAQGWGANHGDVEHLWRHIGYTMQEFRTAVQNYINEKEFFSNMTKEEFNAILDERIGVKYNTLMNVPEWARPQIVKLMNKNIIAGEGKDSEGNIIINLSHDLMRILIILDRQGIFDKE